MRHYAILVRAFRPCLLVAIAAILAGCGPTNKLPTLTGEFAYVANAGDGTISVFSIDGSTGKLTLVQSVPVKPGFRVFGLALHWSWEFLYATIDDASQVEGFAIGDGAFSGQIFGHIGPVAAANGPRAVAIDPSGKYLYVTNYAGNAQVVSQYLVGQQLGDLTPNGTAPTGIRPFGIAVAPAGNCAYVANTGGHSLSQYFIASGGGLASSGPDVSLGGSTDGPGPELVAVQNDPPAASGGGGVSVYVTDDDLKVVHHLSVVSRVIGFSCAVGPPSDYAAGGRAIGIALHPKGNFLYTGNSSSNTISVFAVGVGGTLKLVARTGANLDDPLSVAVDQHGKFLYAANFGNATVAQYKINQTTGALSPIGAGKVNTEAPPNSSSEPVTIVTTTAQVQVLHKP